MNCPKCYGKTTVKDCVNTSEEKYRKRSCASCGHIFFTAEFEIENNEKFKILWGRNYRKHKKESQINEDQNIENQRRLAGSSG